jgi:hypothetical protein
VFFPATEEAEQPVRASALLSEQTVSVTLERRFNLGDYESLNVSYTLGGRIPDDVDPMWALDDMHTEVSERITAGVGPEISQREAIAKESFLSTPRNQQQRIIQLHLQELGIDVDALREVLKRSIDLREVVNQHDAIANANGRMNGHKVHA